MHYHFRHQKGSAETHENASRPIQTSQVRDMLRVIPTGIHKGPTDINSPQALEDPRQIEAISMHIRRMWNELHPAQQFESAHQNSHR